MRAGAHEGEDVRPRVGTLLALSAACHLVEVLFDEGDREAAHAQADWVAERDAIVVAVRQAIAETEVTALAVPRACFDALLAESPRFRDFVFSAYASRLTDLLLLVEEVAFGHIDARLAERLLELSDASGALTLTHQDLAVELGTAREVISRQLKEFERHGYVRRERGRIEIVDAPALREIAAKT